MSYSSLKRKQAIRDLIPEKHIPEPILSDDDDGNTDDISLAESREYIDSDEESESMEMESSKGVTLFMMNHNTNYYNENPETNEKEAYYYLSDESLNQTFAFINDHNESAKENIGIMSQPITYQIHLALFQMKTNEIPIPFLLYLLEKQDEQYLFPTFEYTPAIETDGAGLATDNTDESSIQIQFINACLTHIANLFSKMVTSINESNKKDFYKGFVQTDDRNIYVFFDITTLLEESLPENIRWSSLEEILFYKITNGISISTDLAQLFLKNPELYTIRNQYGNPIPIPHIMYLCRQREDGVFETVLQESEYEEDQSLKPVESMVDHPILGELFCFTYKPIGGYDPRLLRYIGYTENALYLLIEIPSNIDAADFKEIRGLERAVCIYYQEENNQYWGFRNTTDFVQL
jgi:hypothetical protein